MQKLYCYSRSEFEELCKTWTSENHPKNAAFISICNIPGGIDYMFPEESQHHFKTETPEIINLDFDDIPESSVTYQDKTYYGISQEQAERLCKFIDRNRDKDFYIHCEAGLSRSQGIVRYILDVYGEEGYEFETRRANPCLTPNLYVTALLKREYRKLKGI